MKKHILSAQSRTLSGRKVKQLRKQGLLPATVYGKKVKSLSVSIKTDEFIKIHKEAGETGLVELTVGGDVRPVLIHHVQVDPVKSEPLHVEFHQVDLKEKVSARVPLQTTGESPAVAAKLGVLLSVLDEVEVEALPTELPEYIPVDVSILSDVGAELKVSDLKIPHGVTLVTSPELTVVKVGSLVTKEAQEQAAAEEAAAAAAKTTEATEEAPAETPGAAVETPTPPQAPKE